MPFYSPMKEGFSIWGDMDSGEPLVPSDLSMRKNSSIQDLLDSKKTCILKATCSSSICVSYEYIDKLK